MFLLTLFSCLSFFNPSLHVSFTNIKKAEGSLFVGAYNNEADFLKPEKACLSKIVPITAAGNLDLELTELAPGTYAISAFHDVNNNGELDTNIFGIPTEPYGFSNNARPTFRAPRWKEAKFEVPASGTRISIKMEKW